MGCTALCGTGTTSRSRAWYHFHYQVRRVWTAATCQEHVLAADSVCNHTLRECRRTTRPSRRCLASADFVESARYKSVWEEGKEILKALRRLVTEFLEDKQAIIYTPNLTTSCLGSATERRIQMLGLLQVWASLCLSRAALSPSFTVNI